MVLLLAKHNEHIHILDQYTIDGEMIILYEHSVAVSLFLDTRNTLQR